MASNGNNNVFNIENIVSRLLSSPEFQQSLRRILSDETHSFQSNKNESG